MTEMYPIEDNDDFDIDDMEDIELDEDDGDLYSFVVSLYDNAHLNRDIREMTINFDRSSVRNLVSSYYDLQKLRIMTNNRAEALKKVGSPHELVTFYADQLKRLEAGLIKPLDNFAQQFVVGRWAQSIYGIGPVLSAGLVAHIDVTKAPTAGSVWRFAGLDPTSKWDKNKKRPWNAELKTISWKCGQSFMKFSKRDNCFYGHLYRQDKERRIAKNEAGDYAEYAQVMLNTKTWKNENPTKKILQSGKLPDGQIDAQARRFAVKIFLSHFHAVAYQEHFNRPAPRPYIIEHGGHAHEIAIPNFPF